MTTLPVLDFNHIKPSLDRETVEMLKKLYAFYHKKHWGYEKLFRSFQRKNLFSNVVAGKAIVCFAVAGGITLNPIVFATLTAFGVVVKGVAGFKTYDKLAERANFARVEYKKNTRRDPLPSQGGGEPFDEKAFLDRLKMVDDFVSDHCMEIHEKIQAKYTKRFVAE